MPLEKDFEKASIHGERQKDGTIFTGISPDTNKPMYARPEDEGLMWWEGAVYKAKTLKAHGRTARRSFRVPTKRELNVLLQNQEAIGGFNVTGDEHVGWYIADDKNPKIPDCSWRLRFSDGNGDYHHDHYESSVRLVCD
jgi:hypothetical protein